MGSFRERQRFRSFLYRQLVENFENLARAFGAVTGVKDPEQWQRDTFRYIYTDIASLCRIRYRISRFLSRF